MSDRVATPDPPTAKLSPAERDWIRRQARSARALTAEQHRWVRRAAASGGSRFIGDNSGPDDRH